MNSQNSKVGYVYAGCAFIILGLFLPVMNFTSPALTYSVSVWDLAHTINGGNWWGVIVCPAILLGGTIVFSRGGTWVGKFLQIGGHLSTAGETLWTYFQRTETGQIAQDISTQFYEQHGRPIFFGDASLGMGFWLIVIGLILSIIGVYSFKGLSGD